MFCPVITRGEGE